MEYKIKKKLTRGYPPFAPNFFLKELLNNFGLLPELDAKNYRRIWGKLSQKNLFWGKSLDPTYPYHLEWQNSLWRLRANKPGEPSYTLLIDQEVVLSFEKIPETWQVKDKKEK